MRELYRKGMAGADLALNLIVAKGAGAALGANSAAAKVIASNTLGWLTGMEVVPDTVQREIAQGHTNEDALTLGIIRGAIVKLGQSYSINRLLRQPELLVQSGGAGAEWTRQVTGLIESGDKAVIANSARALMRRGYSGEEALALALMPEQPGSFLISGFRALAEKGEIQQDILLSRIAPRLYRDAQATGGTLAPGGAGSTNAAAGNTGTAAGNGVLLPNTSNLLPRLEIPALSFVRNTLNSLDLRNSAIPETVSSYVRNTLENARNTLAQTARPQPLPAGGPLWIEDGNEEQDTAFSYQRTDSANNHAEQSISSENKSNNANEGQHLTNERMSAIIKQYGEDRIRRLSTISVGDYSSSEDLVHHLLSDETERINKGIKGAHERSVFPFGQIKIISRETHDKLDGVEFLLYSPPAKDPKTEQLLPGQFRAKVEMKTVFDASVFTPEEYLIRGLEAAQNAATMTGGALPRRWIGYDRYGIIWEGFWEQGKITTMYPFKEG